MKRGVSFILILCFYACLPKAPVQKMCTEEARAGLTVFVKDSQTNLFLGDSVNVLASDGNYTETLQFFSGSPNSFSGAWERHGNYVLTVSKPGYKNYTSSVIAVAKDECHVMPQTYTVNLQPDKF